MSATHEVFNQVPPLVSFDAADYAPILEALQREGAHDALEELHDVGRLAGSEEAQRWGDLAEAHPPVLRTHDRYGNRIDEVEYDPAYHQLMTTAVEMGLHGAPWADPNPRAHLVRAAKMAVWGQVDPGHGCPISMTYAVVPALRHNRELAEQYEPLLTARVYDPALHPPLTKAGLIAGMSMTEKQGGSDVRAGTTRAVPQSDGSYVLTGHKWFTSAPMSDVFLVLAQAPGGLSCFFLPRVLPDGTRNRMHLQRLKDKLGNHSNASSEVEYDEAVAWLVGEEGRGVRTIIEMVNMTRLDCTIGTATGMRVGTAQAAHHAVHRSAFGAHLVDQPLMRNVLADLAVESEAATTVALWLAALTDRATAGDEHANTLRRISLAVSKYFVCKRGPIHAAEALECLGGNGYVEESRMPRLYREAPLLSVWEGSGNVAALDTLRAMAKQPETLQVFFDELDSAAGADARLDAAVADLKASFSDVSSLEHRARRVVGDMALALQGALLIRHGHPAVADAFCVSRLSGDWGTVFGTLPTGVDTAAIIDRATPKVGS
ncbi:acyl-CoA dehydrogenase family protein [Rhodococcus opacus]|uniref:acyl-CoA dehydrogenase family protein n=1 Tax=Rhodococcus opacus TaxID=37919 RepID=UPI0002A46FF6|nr:acyl-CoA dehydrogenase family protein [Rhodococcus opacus]ELB90590.1 acyl-CoA dehydrogenase [Rhodococcus wratislaviensis IFP 2016]MDX5968744.1 acyl-CoA dehydrogenase family protein [Rhodococcus opacus]NKY70844.1 DNA alkylation response protein [Rhodococcus opacus]CAG7590298.1 Putative acyl-CoA dehydrogenase AidB [Rhodococcus opacus]